MATILHVTEDHSIKNTGITSALDSLVRQVNPYLSQAIACAGTEAISEPESIPIHRFRLSFPASTWRYPLHSLPHLSSLVRQADAVHIHGIWMGIQWKAARTAFKCGVPLVLSTHGMLEPWIWSRQSWPHRLKKVLYWQFLASPVLSRASVVHALTVQEAGHLRQYFPEARIKTIPHALDLAAVDQKLKEIEREPPPIGGSKYLLFLGRLHPVKGLNLLLRAFANITDQKIKLVIAGPAQSREMSYLRELQAYVENTGIQTRVLFTGEVHGREKWRLIRHAWAFCLPSFSEVIGIANLEAAAAGTPVITTFESGVVPEWDQEGGLLAHPETGSLQAALEQAAGWDLKLRQDRGAALRKLVERCYSWNAITPQWIALYQELITQK